MPNDSSKDLFFHLFPTPERTSIAPESLHGSLHNWYAISLHTDRISLVGAFKAHTFTYLSSSNNIIERITSSCGITERDGHY